MYIFDASKWEGATKWEGMHPKGRERPQMGTFGYLRKKGIQIVPNLVSSKEGDPNSSQFGYFLKIIYPNYNLGKLIPQIGRKFYQIGKNIPKWEIRQIEGHNLSNMSLFGELLALVYLWWSLLKHIFVMFVSKSFVPNDVLFLHQYIFCGVAWHALF